MEFIEEFNPIKLERTIKKIGEDVKEKYKIVESLKVKLTEMKKLYNNKFRKHNDLQVEVRQHEASIDKIQNDILKYLYKMKSTISIVDASFFNQFEVSSTRINKDLYCFFFDFLGFANHKYESVKSLIGHEDDLVLLLEGALTRFEITNHNIEDINGYNQTNEHDIQRNKCLRVSKKYSKLISTFPKSEFIYPFNYIYEFIDYVLKSSELSELSFKKQQKLEEIIGLSEAHYSELKVLENEILDSESKKKNYKKYIELSLEILEKYKSIMGISDDMNLRQERILMLDKDLVSFQKLEQIKLQLKNDSSKRYSIKSEFSDESNSDIEEISHGQIFAHGRSFMNKTSYVDNLLENLHLNDLINNDEVDKEKAVLNIPDCIKKSKDRNSTKSLGLNTSMESSKSVTNDTTKKQPSLNPFNKYNSSGIRKPEKQEKHSSNHPIKIVNMKKLNRDVMVSDQQNPSSKVQFSILNSYYEDVSEKETVSINNKSNKNLGLKNIKNRMSGEPLLLDPVLENDPVTFINNNYSNTNLKTREMNDDFLITPLNQINVRSSRVLYEEKDTKLRSKSQRNLQEFKNNFKFDKNVVKNPNGCCVPCV